MNIFCCLSGCRVKEPESHHTELVESRKPVVSHHETPLGNRMAHRKIKRCDICELRFTGLFSKFDVLRFSRLANGFERKVENRSSIQVLNCKLLSCWLSKPEDYLIRHAKVIGKVNSAAFLVIKKLCDQKNRFHFCSLPSLLIMTRTSEHWFVENIRSAIERLRIDHIDVCRSVEESGGLLKTPLIVTRYNGNCFDRSRLEKITPDFYFYKAVDYNESSGSALLTLYVNGNAHSRESFLNDLNLSLVRAIEFANENLPSESRMIICEHLKSDISLPVPKLNHQPPVLSPERDQTLPVPEDGYQSS